MQLISNLRFWPRSSARASGADADHHHEIPGAIGPVISVAYCGALAIAAYATNRAFDRARGCRAHALASRGFGAEATGGRSSSPSRCLGDSELVIAAGRKRGAFPAASARGRLLFIPGQTGVAPYRGAHPK